MDGKVSESQKYYREAWETAIYSSPSVWLKVCAAIKSFSESEVETLKEASLIFGEPDQFDSYFWKWLIIR